MYERHWLTRCGIIVWGNSPPIAKFTMVRAKVWTRLGYKYAIIIHLYSPQSDISTDCAISIARSDLPEDYQEEEEEE